MFGLRVEQIGEYVKIAGFPINQFRNDLKKRWGTNKLLYIYELSFSWFSSYGILRVHNFFLLELVYVLSQLPQRKVYKDLTRLLYENTWIKQTTQDFSSRVDFRKLGELKRSLKPWQLEFLQV